jgi:hypothetical protein
MGDCLGTPVGDDFLLHSVTLKGASQFFSFLSQPSLSTALPAWTRHQPPLSPHPCFLSEHKLIHVYTQKWRGEEKIIDPTRLKLWPLGHPAHSQSLYQLHYPGSHIHYVASYNNITVKLALWYNSETWVIREGKRIAASEMRLSAPTVRYLTMG